MKAKTIKGKTPEEIQKALAEAMADSFEPTLATVFLSVKLDFRAISSILDQEGIQVFGVTTEGGEILDSEVEKESVAIMLMDPNPGFFKVLFEEVGSRGYRETAAALAKKAQNFCSVPTLLVSGSGVWNKPFVEPLLDGFVEIIGEEAVVFGGMAGDDLSLKESFVFTNDQVSNYATIAIVFDDSKISMKGITTCGWKSIGTTKSITSSDGNQVFGIDGEPALDLVMRYAGISELPDNLPDIQMALNQSLQIQLQREKGEAVMRVGMVNVEDRSLTFMGSMDEGTKIKFCLLPDLDTLDNSVQVVEKFRNSEIPEADAVLLFSCIGRVFSFGPEIIREIEGLNSVWEAPLAGFYSQGELGRATGGGLEVHNLTICLVALKEK